MTRAASSSIAALAAVALACIARSASALGPVDVEVAAKAGGGTDPFSDANHPINPLGFGLGARGGVGLFGAYAGLGFTYYFGGSTMLPTHGGFEGRRSLLYGVELGYDFKLAIVTLRPQLGIGNYKLTQVNASDASLQENASYADTNNLYLEPGGTVLVSFGRMFVGADASVLVLPGFRQDGGASATSTAFTAHGQVGVRF